MVTRLKGVVLMAGFLSQALSSLFCENAELIDNAKILGGVAACRIHRREAAVNVATGERVFRWQIEFRTQEDMDTFDATVLSIVDAATEGE